MNQNPYSEIIDAYLRGELSDSDKLSLEQLANRDPLVKGEIQLQQDIVEAIRQSREKELKHRLNALPVSSSPTLPTMTSFSKVALVGTLFLSVALMSILLSFEPEKQHSQRMQNQQIDAPRNNQEQLIRKTDEQAIEERAIKEFPVISDMPVVALKVEKEAPKQTTQKAAVRSTENQVKSNKAILATEQTLGKNTHVLANLSDKLQKQKINTLHYTRKEPASSAQFEYYDVNQDKRVYDGQNEESLESIATKNKLSYQYYDDMLFMYNNVSRGEKISIKDENSALRYFLYYEGEFYELNENQIERTELSPIRNQKLIRQLKKLISNE